MSNAVAVNEKVKGAELADWLFHDSAGERELIVEAATPSRQVSYGGRSGRHYPVDLKAPPSEARSKVLNELQAFLTGLLGTPPVLLAAAGALAVKANCRQARRLAEHPLVKAIRVNRRLTRPKVLLDPKDGNFPDP